MTILKNQGGRKHYKPSYISNKGEGENKNDRVVEEEFKEQCWSQYENNYENLEGKIF